MGAKLDYPVTPLQLQPVDLGVRGQVQGVGEPEHRLGQNR